MIGFNIDLANHPDATHAELGMRVCDMSGPTYQVIILETYRTGNVFASRATLGTITDDLGAGTSSVNIVRTVIN